MKRLELKPNGFPCTLKECPPGPFLSGEQVGFKSEYADNDGFLHAYNEAGEYFHGDNQEDIVTPLVPEWIEEEV